MKGCPLLCAWLLGVAAGCSSSSEAATPVADANLPVISISARQWAFSPASITLQKGVPVFLELSSTDVHHGFNLPDLGVRTDVLPGQKVRVRVTPDKTGTFGFFCDFFCGSGHEGMQGQVVVQ